MKRESRKKRRQRLGKLSHEAWEAICRRCGDCCYERFIGEHGEIIAWGPPCVYLDEASRTCVAYGRRFQLDVECKRITPRTLARPHILPPRCAYRRLVEEVEDP